MRCKPGDLAIVTYSPTGREGLIVEVVSWVGRATTANFGPVDDGWIVRYHGSCKHPDTGRRLMARDQDLVPICEADTAHSRDELEIGA